MTCGTLMVIDDEPAITALFKRLAHRSGYEVIATSDAEEFKQHVRAGDPDLICLDLGMPGTDGIELLRFHAAEECPCRVLIMSGSDRQMLETALRLAEALGLDIVGSIPKPLQIAEVRDLLDSLCRPG
jgi:DNA-binding response OmpR family regulator